LGRIAAPCARAALEALHLSLNHIETVEIAQGLAWKIAESCIE
jgi:hypothetical protein